MKDRAPIIFLILLGFLTIFPGLASKDFFTRGEPREALVAQAMVATGNWILPEGYGGVIPSKPPLMHWLISISSLPYAEVTEFTSRLPSAVAALLFIAAFFVFVRKRAGNTHAWCAATILLTSLEWIRAATIARVDMILAASLGGGLLSLFRWEERGLKSVPFQAIFFLTVAFLAKGPVGVVLPCGILFIYLLVRGYPFLRVIGSCFTVAIPSTLIALIWYYLGYKVGGEAFLQKIYEENIARFSGTMEEDAHRHSVIYLLGMLLLGVMPWTLSLPVVEWMRSVWKIRKELFLKSDTGFLKTDKLTQFSAIVVIVIFVFFCLPSSKRSVYLLPLYPFLSFLIASIFIARKELMAKRLKYLSVGVGLVCLLLTIAGIVVYCSVGNETNELIVAIRREMTLPLSLLTAFLPLTVSLFAFWRSKEVNLSAATLYSTFLLQIISLIILVNYPLGNALAHSLSSKPFAALIRAEVSHRKLYSYGNEFYGMSFYLKQRINRLETEAGPPPKESGILVYDRDVEELKVRMNIKLIAESANSIVKQGQKLLLVSVE